MFTSQHSGYAGTHATYGLIGTVHNVPSTLYSSRVGMFCCKMKFTHYVQFLMGFAAIPHKTRFIKWAAKVGALC
jgi:hypothetical protein